jgi:hypothetical protein
MKTPEEIRNYIKAHPGITVEAIQKNMRSKGLLRSHITNVMSEMGIVPGRGSCHNAGNVLPKQTTSNRKPLKLLLEEFDDVAKVQRALNGLGKADYIEDEEMRRSLRISTVRWRDVRQQTALADWFFTLPNKRFVWIHPEAQQKLIAAINLSSQ